METEVPTLAPQFTTADFTGESKVGRALFVRGLLFGCGGALAGLVLYSLVGIVTGLVIGYVSLAVGWIVAKAILTGSKGRGGRRYQIAAVALTYAAVSMSAIPIAIAQGIAHPQEQAPSATASGDAKSDQGARDQPASLGGAIGMLALIGLASPFLEMANPAQGAIGLVILAIGMRIAWRMTASREGAIREAFAGAGADSPTSLNLSR